MSYLVCPECGGKEFKISMEQGTVECCACHKILAVNVQIGTSQAAAVLAQVDLSADFVIEKGVLCKYTGSDTEIVIPEGVTEIADDCFREKVLIESITLPSTLTKIGAYAFSKCKSIVSVYVPDSVKIIETGAFAGCASLKTVRLPENLERLGDSVFFGCVSLKK